MFGDGVQSLCGGGDVAQLREDAAPLAQQFNGSVSVGAGRVGGGEVVFGAFDGGAGLAVVGAGGAQVLGAASVVCDHGEQGVGGLLVLGGDEHEFVVGVTDAAGEPAQLRGGEGVGLVDDDQAPQRWCVVLGGEVVAVALDAVVVVVSA